MYKHVRNNKKKKTSKIWKITSKVTGLIHLSCQLTFVGVNFCFHTFILLAYLLSLYVSATGLGTGDILNGQR